MPSWPSWRHHKNRDKTTTKYIHNNQPNLLFSHPPCHYASASGTNQLCWLLLYCISEIHDAMVENDDDGDFLILWIFGLLRVARWSEVASQYPGGRTGTSNGTAVGPAAVFNFSGYGTVHCLRGKVPVQQKPCFLIATGAQHGSVIPGKPMLLPVATSNSACLYKIFGMRVGSRACC